MAKDKKPKRSFNAGKFQLPTGSKGVFITAHRGKERQAQAEILQLLEEVCQRQCYNPNPNFREWK